MAVAWRFLVLFAFGVNTALNAIQFMDFASVPDVAMTALGGTNSTLTENNINALYSASLFSVLPATFPAMYFLGRRNYLATGAGVLCNVLGAWLRFFAVLTQSYALAMISSILVGFAAAVIICSYTHLSGRWFPAGERTFATSVAVQCNYAGWCIGTLIPLSVTTVATLKNFMLWQALLGSSAIVLFALFHREKPKGDINYAQLDNLAVPAGADSDSDKDENGGGDGGAGAHGNGEHGGEEMSMVQSVKTMFANLQFDLQCLAFAMLGGISFTIPAVQAEIFYTEGFTNAKSCWTNFAFVFSGVVTGVSLGARVKDKTIYPALLKYLFLLCSVALSLLAWICNEYSIGSGKDIAPDTIYPIFILLMAVAGGTSLGFVGIGLNMASDAAHPVGHEYSGGAVEWFINVIGAVLALVATGPRGFALVAVLCWGVTVLVFVGLRRPKEGHARASPAAAAAAPAKRQHATGGLSISADADA